ncbi:MAG: ABC transporter ATP-binding protein [Pseudomonadota bacterium]
MSTAPDQQPLLRLAREHFVQHWRWFVFGTLCAVITSGSAVSYGFLIKVLGDRLQLAAEGIPITSSIWLLPGLIVVAACIRAVSLYLMTMANNTGLQRALVDVSNRQYAALIHGDHSRLSGEASGGFVSRFIHDINSLRDVGLRFANNVPKNIATVTGALIALLWMDWQLALVLLVAYPVAFAPVIAIGNGVRKRARQSQEQAGEITAFLAEGFQSARAVTAYGLEDYQKQKASLGFKERARLFLKVLSNKAAVDPILEIAGGIAVAGVLAFSAWRIAQGASTIGDFLGFVALIGIAAPELRSLGSITAAAQEGRAAAFRVYALVDEEQSVTDAPDAKPFDGTRSDIEFDNVRFSYQDGAEETLKGLSLSIKAGETVAIVGPSGAGKSTLFNLLLRLYDVSAGVVRVGGSDVRDVRMSNLRASMALVDQEPALFDDTIYANIALGRPGTLKQDVQTAATAASVDEFVSQLPMGLETQVGERGSRLSGGQRQRVALARAVLRNAPILLLDEATSALDAETEQTVGAAIRKFAVGRTVLVIAHRLSTVQWADRVVVIEDGRVVEEGSHGALEGAGGTYARLVKAGLG